MKPKYFLIGLLGTAVGLGATSVLAAGKTALSGEITDISKVQPSLAASSSCGLSLCYKDTVMVTNNLSGDPASNSMVYVTLVCTQGATVVYQSSVIPQPDTSSPGEFWSTFSLIDQSGQGLEWDGGAAQCTAALLYRVQKGKSVSITQLDSWAFDVGAQP